MANRPSKTTLLPSELMRRRQDEIRQQIRASQLVNRLEDAALGKVVITSVQANAAIALLRKVVPDLSSVDQTVTGDDLRPVTIKIVNA
jgi:hypothetical protein